MKLTKFLLAICILAVSLVFARAADTSPTPVYANPDTFQENALKWITVGTAIAAALSTFAAFVITKIGELTRTIQGQREELGGRLDRQQNTLLNHQGQINTIAVAVPPPAVAVATGTAPGGATGTTALLGLAIACFVCLSFLACSTTGTDAAKNARRTQALNSAGAVIGKVAVSTLFNVASQELGGSKANFGSAAAAGLWANVNTANALDAVSGIVSAYSGGNAPNTAKAVNSAIASVTGDPSTPDVVGALATVISTAAGAPPALAKK